MDRGAAVNLVATKLTAPTPPAELINRERLERALDAAVADPAVRMVLISAPAGSGKSTLAAEWSGHRNCGWLQVDPADRDPARFWGHVVAALGRAVPDIEAALNPAVPGSGADAAPLIEALTNALDASGAPVALVVDDYHVIDNPAVDAGVEQLVGFAPQNFTLVMCSRLDPPLPLARLRVRGHLAEIRAEDLRFEPDEAAELFMHRGGTTERRHIEALCERTEGWAAGLVLADLSLAGAADRDAFLENFRGDDRLVVDYLTDELLSQATDADRRRYLETSILDEMSGPLIDAVCDCTDGSSWLRATADGNQLLIGLDRSRQWFRYHHLLRDMLRLEAEVAVQVDELHRRAGRWHRVNGDLDRAAEHLLAAGELEVAADVIAEHSMDLLNRGQAATVAGYLDRLGGALETHPICFAFHGWIQLVAGRVEAAEDTLRRLRALDTDDESALGFIATLGVMVNLSRGNLADALIDAEASPATSDATVTLTIGQAQIWAGRFDDGRRHLTRATDLAEQNQDLFALAGIPVMSAIIAIESNDPTEARRCAERALAVIDETPSGSRLHLGLSHSIMGRTSDDAETDVDADAAIEAVLTGVETTRRTANDITLVYALTSAADVLCSYNRPEGLTVLEEARRVADRCTDPGIAGTYLARIEGREGTAAPVRSEGLVEELTDRELAVLRYLPSPMSQRDIAAELYVSLNTVKTHCKAIYRKLGVGDRKAAVQAARSESLL